MAGRSSYRFLVAAAIALTAIFATLEISARDLVVRQLADTTDFPPRCKCNRDPAQSPYRLSDPFINDDNDDYSVTETCYKIIDVGGCDRANKCCNGKQGVEKIEIRMTPGRGSFCKDWFKYATLNGKRKSFIFSTADSLIRISNMGLNATTAPGSTICLAFTSWSDCNGPGWMCFPTGGVCKVAIFNKDRSCCPVSWTGDRQDVDYDYYFYSGGRNNQQP